MVKRKLVYDFENGPFYSFIYYEGRRIKGRRIRVEAWSFLSSLVGYTRRAENQGESVEVFFKDGLVKKLKNKKEIIS